jgi:hypothetical protein
MPTSQKEPSVEENEMWSWLNHKPGVALRRARSLVLFVALLFSAGTGMADVLQEGTWSGTYTKRQYLAQYHVNTRTEGGETRSEIKMVLPELEPRTDFTFALKNVVVKDSSLSFTILKKNETQKCNLQKQESNQYLGKCQSDADADGVALVDITMTPPFKVSEDEVAPDSNQAPGNTQPTDVTKSLPKSGTTSNGSGD